MLRPGFMRNQLSKGGDHRTDRYFSPAVPWEGIAKAQERTDRQALIDPTEKIKKALAKVTEDVERYLEGDSNIDKRTTRQKIQMVGGLIGKYLGRQNEFFTALVELEKSLKPKKAKSENNSMST